MNTQTAGVWVKASIFPKERKFYNARNGASNVPFLIFFDPICNEWSTESGYLISPDLYDTFDYLDESIPTLTIQQALEVWDACDNRIEEFQQYPYGKRSGKYKNPDKRTYFLNKFGFDIDKM